MNSPKLNIACVETLMTEHDLQSLAKRHISSVSTATFRTCLSDKTFSAIVFGTPDMKKLASAALMVFREVLMSTGYSFVCMLLMEQVNKITDYRKYLKLMRTALPHDAPVNKNSEAFKELVNFFIDMKLVKITPLDNNHMFDGEWIK